MCVFVWKTKVVCDSAHQMARIGSTISLNSIFSVIFFIYKIMSVIFIFPHTWLYFGTQNTRLQKMSEMLVWVEQSEWVEITADCILELTGVTLARLFSTLKKVGIFGKIWTILKIWRFFLSILLSLRRSPRKLQSNISDISYQNKEIPLISKKKTCAARIHRVEIACCVFSALLFRSRRNYIQTRQWVKTPNEWTVNKHSESNAVNAQESDQHTDAIQWLYSSRICVEWMSVRRLLHRHSSSHIVFVKRTPHTMCSTQ